MMSRALSFALSVFRATICVAVFSIGFTCCLLLVLVEGTVFGCTLVHGVNLPQIAEAAARVTKISFSSSCLPDSVGIRF